MSSPHRNQRSLRIWLPLLVALLAFSGGLVVYTIGLRVHRRDFEQEFKANQLIRATRIQSEVDRWVSRNDLEMVETVLAELGVFPEITGAFFLDETNTVLAATRRQFLSRPFESRNLGTGPIDAAALASAMEQARRTLTSTSLMTPDQNRLVVCLPSSLPLHADSLGVRPGGLLIVAYDLRPERAGRLQRIHQEFIIYLINIVVIAVTLGVALHLVITRRLERLESAMADFAAGKTTLLPASPTADEISRLEHGFNDMAAAIQKAMHEVEDLYNHAPCGYHSLDGTGIIVRINDTELTWLGYKREELVGKVNFADLLTPPSLARFSENFPVFKEQGAVRDLEYELVRKDGTILPVVLSSTAVKDANGAFLKGRSVLYDVTELKRAEEKISGLNAELERRVELRTKQLEEVNRELVAFSYSISHDLRTPLRSINGFSYTLLRDYGDKLDEKGLDDLRRVRIASQRMGQLIDDMVRLLHVSQVEMHWSHVDLTRVATKVAADLAAAEPNRKVEFTAAHGCSARGDSNLLRIVLENALENAWKYTRPQPNAKIEFGRATGHGEDVYFVRDNGCGFDMRYANKLFGAFQRLHTDSESAGTGIGLACIRRIVQRHGGSTWIEGTVGEGTTLYFTLPGAREIERPLNLEKTSES